MNIEIRDEKNESFYNVNNKLICKKKCNVFIDGVDRGIYGWPTEHEIYESIKVNKEIYFPKCIIPEFYIYPEKYANNAERIELKKIDLSCSIFVEHQHYHFSNIDINGIINFKGAIFYGATCLFEKCKFEASNKGNPKIDFTSIKCKRAYISFSVNIIDSHLDFTFSHFQKSIIDFDNTNIQQKTNKVRKLNGRLIFYAASLDNKSRIRIISSRIETMLDFRFNDWQGDVSLINVDIEKCKHIDFWTNSINGTFDAFGLSKQIIRCIKNSIIDHKNVDASILLMLKNSFNKLGYFDDEDNLYVAFRRCQAKAKLEESKKKGLIKKIGGFLIYCGNRFMFDFVGGYGTKPRNVFRFMIIVVLGFTPLYAFIPNFLQWNKITKHFCSIEFFNKLLIGLYHSMITFLTIGYGDVEPESVCGSLLSGIEGFLGLFLMAYFTIAFSRKVLR